VVSKPSAAEGQFLDIIKRRMAEGDIRSVISGEPATDFHHPLSVSFWESGKALKAHDWLGIPVTQREHDLYHRLGKDTWQTMFGSHQELLIEFWEKIGFVPGDFMKSGMDPKRAQWFDRVMGRLRADFPKLEHLTSSG
jgi:hypothetical protein